MVSEFRAKRNRGVLPLSVVDKSDFSPNRLTVQETPRIFASQGALPSPHFKQ
jgi:hypothetical protein